MILDSLQNAGMYESVHPHFRQAFEFLRSTDLPNLPLGKIELDGTNLFVNVVEINAQTVTEAKLETHQRYIDIQLPVSSSEIMGWIAGSELKLPTTEYNVDKDVAFFGDKATNFIDVKPYEFAVFFPSDGHQPGIADRLHKKIIVKVLV
jgi:YhcH/YjgK/YiaL family protein